MGRVQPTTILWAAIGGVLVGYCLGLRHFSERFGHAVALTDMPILELVGAGIIAGALIFALPPLARLSGAGSDRSALKITGWILVVGLCMRLAFMGSTPIIEDDNQRYLWDGAVTANGLNPYETAPGDVLDGRADDPVLVKLAEDAGPVLYRINYPDIRTVYPPVAQGAFALAYWIAPFDLDAWRLVVLICDLGVAAFIILLLNAVSRPLPWLSLYWWNPVVVKELHNSAHMDVLVVLAFVAALWFALRPRLALSASAIAFGFGAKIWPVLLIPTLVRNHLSNPAKLIVPGVIGTALCAAFAMPVILSQLDDTSGFVAYGGEWQANDALFRAIEWCIIQVMQMAGAEAHARLVTRLLVGLVLLGVVFAINRDPAQDANELARRVFITIGALLLLSPTQFPWYFCWLAALLPLFPLRGFLLLTVTLPLYYTYFHLAPRDAELWFHYGIVALIWVPVWVLLVLDWYRGRLFDKQRRQSTLAEEA